MIIARVTAAKAQETKTTILDAAKRVLLDRGYAGLTTRAVAGVAHTPMSQIQYHFGSKQGMVLALFEYLNSQLLERQTAMFNDPDLKLSEQWSLACDYLDDDMASGYVRVFQELMAVGWASPEVGLVVREGTLGWAKILTELAEKAEDAFGALGPFTPAEIAALVGAMFVGAEAQLLLGLEEQGIPLRRCLRRFGEVIRTYEERGTQ